MQHSDDADETEVRVIFDGIEWDENNLDHAYRRVTAAEIEQVITNATLYRHHQRHPDRAWL